MLRLSFAGRKELNHVDAVIDIGTMVTAGVIAHFVIKWLEDYFNKRK